MANFEEIKAEVAFQSWQAELAEIKDEIEIAKVKGDTVAMRALMKKARHLMEGPKSRRTDELEWYVAVSACVAFIVGLYFFGLWTVPAVFVLYAIFFVVTAIWLEPHAYDAPTPGEENVT